MAGGGVARRFGGWETVQARARGSALHSFRGPRLPRAISLAAGAATAQVASPVSEPGPATSSITGNPAATTSRPAPARWPLAGATGRMGPAAGRAVACGRQRLVAGGAQPGSWTANSALFVNVTVDAGKLVDWRGAAFSLEFLQFNGNDSNGQAGVFPGHKGITSFPPFNRSELFQAWYRQSLVKDVLKVRRARFDGRRHRFVADEPAPVRAAERTDPAGLFTKRTSWRRSSCNRRSATYRLRPRRPRRPAPGDDIALTVLF